ncbi:MAG: AAA family ATPase, partial [bacterium]|nr:AAA family ATPase [bacterium]
MSENSNGASAVLYRKYRPQSFKEVLGQEHVVEALEGAIKLGRVAHAYLFCGSRGTGKTSVARILANALGTSESDLYEIDAASNRGIDDIRLLREGVSSVPFESKYKIYIVDEVHMLTKEAFNALLKTLEEPPAHVIFILATTELEKV